MNVYLFKEFLQRDDATSAARQFCEEHNAELCVIYGLREQEGNVTKDIAVFALNNLEAAGMVRNNILSIFKTGIMLSKGWFDTK